MYDFLKALEEGVDIRSSIVEIETHAERTADTEVIVENLRAVMS